MNYYQEKEKEINLLISKKEYGQALKIIEEELNVSYIPNLFEKKLINFKSLINSKEKPNLNYKKLDFNDVLKIINNPKLKLEIKYDMLSILTEFNLRKYLDDINKIFLNEKINNILKFKILNELKKQDINSSFILLINFKKKVVDLNKFIEISYNKNFAKDSRKIEEFLFDDPITLDFALILLEKFYLYNSIINNKLSDIWLETLYIVSKSLNYDNLINKLITLIENEETFYKKINYLISDGNFI